MRVLTVIAVAMFATSCTTSQDSAEFRPGRAIHGLGSPIKLNPDTTTVHLADYFFDVGKVDTLYFEPDLPVQWSKDSGLVYAAGSETHPPVFTMAVVYEDTLYHIPVFKSKKRAYRFEYFTDGAPKEVSVKSNFNGWNHKATPLRFLGAGKWIADLSLEPGLYEYLVVEDGREMLDPNNPDKKDNGLGGYNSTFRVGEESVAPEIFTLRASADSVVIDYGRHLLDPVILIDDSRIPASAVHRHGDRLSIHTGVFPEDRKRTYLRVYGGDADNRSNDLLIPLEWGRVITDPADLTGEDKHAYSMYFLMVDRFVNGDPKNDRKVGDPDILPPANYFGGDLQGVSQKFREGYFRDLGTNLVWLSPIAQNPLGAYGLWDKGGVVSKFSGYHGYWPISSFKVDFRFGGEAALRELLDEAHRDGSRVILDYVANHVHQEHPVYVNHPEWATDLYLPDGSLNTERWDEHRLTTWFDTFMPTLELRDPHVAEVMSDSALFWLEAFDLDGFRHDATKHIALDFWRILTRKIKYEVAVPQGRAIYQIGETYGSPELIDSYIGSGLLDGQFDFNLYDAAVAAFAKDDGDLANLDRVFRQSLETYGHHHLMGNISGNQDRTRFISYADGSVDFSEDPKLAGWTRDIQISDTIGYSRLALLHAFNFTSPGIPVIYYGDEIGMPGANDPDNRRMMRFGDELNPRERDMLKTVTELVHLRKSNMALLYGDTKIIHLDDDSWAYVRNYFDRSALVVFNLSDRRKDLEIEIPEIYGGEGWKAAFGNAYHFENRTLRISLPPVSFEILTH